MSEVERCRETYRGMEVVSDGDWVHFEDYEGVRKERDDWQEAHKALLATYNDIGQNLGAVFPFDLVNDVARKRMEEIKVLKRQADRDRSFSANTAVKVTLTEAGAWQYNDHYKNVPNATRFKKGDVLQCQVWTLMQVFGPMMYLGAPVVPFKDNEIEFIRRSK